MPAKFKRSAQDPRAQSAEIRDQKIAIGGVIFLGGSEWGGAAAGALPGVEIGAERFGGGG